MCIFAQPVVSVTDTNIFARLLPNGWQHLVYQMKFATKQANAIILPLPVKLPSAEESLKFVSLKGYGKFFTDLNKGYPLVAAPSRGKSRSLKVDSAQPEKKIAVHHVGDFVASFVPTIADFNRLDSQFRVPQESWDKIPTYADYGFAVFQLKTRSGRPHPMAFRFRSRLATKQNAATFFPTVHIHDGQVHARERFDHTLFLQSPEFDKVCGDYVEAWSLVTDKKTGYVRSKWNAERFCSVEKSAGILDANGLVHRMQMRGKFKNTDILAHNNLSHSASSALVLPALAVAGAAGLKWFCDRRGRVAEEESDNS